MYASEYKLDNFERTMLSAQKAIRESSDLLIYVAVSADNQ